MITMEQLGAINGTERARLGGYELGVYDCANGNAADCSGSQEYLEGYAAQYAKESSHYG